MYPPACAPFGALELTIRWKRKDNNDADPAVNRTGRGQHSIPLTSSKSSTVLCHFVRWFHVLCVRHMMHMCILSKLLKDCTEHTKKEILDKWETA